MPNSTSFRATVELGGKTATGIEVPADVVAALGSNKRPAFSSPSAGHSYRTTVASMRGRFLVPLNAKNRAAAGVIAASTSISRFSSTPRHASSRCPPTSTLPWQASRQHGSSSNPCPSPIARNGSAESMKQKEGPHPDITNQPDDRRTARPEANTLTRPSVLPGPRRTKRRAGETIGPPQLAGSQCGIPLRDDESSRLDDPGGARAP